MARLVPAELGEKVRRVLRAAEVARGADRRHFDFTGEVEAGVRLVLSEAGDVPLAFSLWSRPQDIAALCADASVPATAALLATVPVVILFMFIEKHLVAGLTSGGVKG